MIGRNAEFHISHNLTRSRDFLRCLAGAALILLSLPCAGLAVPGLSRLSVQDVLLLLAIAINGLPIIVEAAQGLVKRELNVDELVGAAILACLITGAYMEGAIVSAIMVFGALVEEAVSDGARDAIRSLAATTPETAQREQDGVESTVAIAEVRPGDCLVVRPGDLVPVDGTILDGKTEVNEAAITGESIPVLRQSGDTIFAGTTCVDGLVRLRADHVGSQSAMGRIIALVEAAEGQQTNSGRIVDRYGAWFTPVILALAALTFVITGDVTRAITVLIVGCPCSFLLSSPVTVIAAIGRAARHGILIKGGKYLEAMAEARGFFFDKTGTLTRGQPEVVAIHAGATTSPEQVLTLAAAVEIGSLHPLGQAIVEQARAQGLALPAASDLRTEIGRGVMGRIDGQTIAVVTSQAPGADGLSCVDVLIDGQPAGRIELLDHPREGARQTIAALRAAGIDDLTMISGDQPQAVARVARDVGITQAHAAQKPAEKLALITAYAKGKTVYVGDGINDAPALKAASAGIAMGLRGVDVALETADIVLMNDRLDHLPFLVRLGRKMARTIKLGIFLSFAINVVAVAASFLGLLTPILGAVTHNLGSILVVSLAASLRFSKDV